MPHIVNGEWVWDNWEEDAAPTAEGASIEAIRARPHVVMSDFFVGYDLYVEGYTVTRCINAEEVSGWYMAMAGEQDVAAAEMQAAREEDRWAYADYAYEDNYDRSVESW